MMRTLDQDIYDHINIAQNEKRSFYHPEQTDM